MTTIDKVLSVVLATAIGIGYACILVMWWTV
jgi:uncharacterized membrane protein YgaE (UPF0421/DUF939 family)